MVLATFRDSVDENVFRITVCRERRSVVGYGEYDVCALNLNVETDGMLYIIGLKEGVTLTGKETEAPTGYNKLTTDVTLSPQVLETEVYKESGTRYYDADGNLVSENSETTTEKTVVKNLEDLDAEAVEIVNEAGSVLPSTGGIGTTIFYIVGGLLAVGAGVVLVTKKRMSKEDV